MSACGGMSGLHPMSLSSMGSSMYNFTQPMIDYTQTRDIPPYRGNNVGPGFDAAQNTFRRLQDNALNSPNFALDYANGREIIDRNAYNYHSYQPGRYF